MLRNTSILILFIFYSLSNIFAQKTSDKEQRFQQLNKLKNTSRILYIAAHPDDENTNLISYLTNVVQCDVAYMSLTRGDGGQNLIGSEQGDALGLIRTNELIEARKIDGATQYFSRAIDFGFSKTTEETFKFWNKEKILADVVWVIRTFKPTMIITRFSPKVSIDLPTHGHHTASAMLAVEAFEKAANPMEFPEQLKKTSIWKTEQIYWNCSWWHYGSKELFRKKISENPNLFVKISSKKYSADVNKSFSEIAARSRSQHVSQGYGNSPVLENQDEFLFLLSGNPKLKFSELNQLTWLNENNGKLIQQLIKKVVKKYNKDKPEASVEGLLKLYGHIKNCSNSALAKAKLNDVKSLIFSCLGIKTQMHFSSNYVHLGESVSFEFNFMNPSSIDVKVESLFSNALRINKVIKTSSRDGRIVKRRVPFVIPQSLKPSHPYWLSYTKDKGMFNIDKQNLIGSPMGFYPFDFELTIKVNEVVLKTKIAAKYQVIDLENGLKEEPIIIRPDVMLNLKQQVYFFTKSKGKRIEVDVIAGKNNISGFVELNLPKGWISNPVFYKTSLNGLDDKKHFVFNVVPPNKESKGVVRAIFKTKERVFGRSFIQLNYNHIDKWAMFPSAQALIVKSSINVLQKRIGYFKGTGDIVSQCLESIGYEVVELDKLDYRDLKNKNIDVVIMGIRAYNFVDEIALYNKTLNKFVKDGGTAIIQYNKNQKLITKDIGPYSLTLSNSRVTEEDAPVRFLKPNHRVFNTPNKVTITDFDGWIQERGVYFPIKWDSAYTTLLEMHDKGDANNQSSLLIAQYGKGNVVYTGLSFFRQLPAGVEGAYKLMVNIISL